MSASVGPTDLHIREQRRRRKAITMLVSALLLLQMALLIAFSLFGAGPFASQSTTGQAWRVTQVRAQGVEIATGTGKQISAFIPIGSKLPTGEVLISTAPDKQAYATNAATVVLRTPARR